MDDPERTYLTIGSLFKRFRHKGKWDSKVRLEENGLVRVRGSTSLFKPSLPNGGPLSLFDKEP